MLRKQPISLITPVPDLHLRTGYLSLLAGLVFAVSCRLQFTIYLTFTPPRNKSNDYRVSLWRLMKAPPVATESSKYSLPYPTCPIFLFLSFFLLQKKRRNKNVRYKVKPPVAQRAPPPPPNSLSWATHSVMQQNVSSQDWCWVAHRACIPRV
jgi:hypothetical protein